MHVIQHTLVAMIGVHSCSYIMLLVVLCLVSEHGVSWMDIKQQAVALINEDICINFGKCYTIMVCNDSEYQAVTFDPRYLDKLVYG